MAKSKLLLVTGLAFLLSFGGCASIEKASKSENTFIACRVGDTVTTIAALQAGAVEANPLMAGLLSHGYLPFIAVQFFIAHYISSHWNELSDNTKVVVNTVGCIPVVNNLAVLGAN